jgi:hypothetical protein
MRFAASALATLSVDERERSVWLHRHHDAICFAAMRSTLSATGIMTAGVSNSVHFKQLTVRRRDANRCMPRSRGLLAHHLTY